MEKNLDIQSQELEYLARTLLHNFDSVSARHGVSLHTIVGTLHRYIGVTEEYRPKGRDRETGVRVQHPTVRRLPPRRVAIEHAWENRLLIEDEYRAGTNTPALSRMPDDQHL